LLYLREGGQSHRPGSTAGPQACTGRSRAFVLSTPCLGRGSSSCLQSRYAAYNCSYITKAQPGGCCQQAATKRSHSHSLSTRCGQPATCCTAGVHDDSRGFVSMCRLAKTVSRCAGYVSEEPSWLVGLAVSIVCLVAALSWASLQIGPCNPLHGAASACLPPGDCQLVRCCSQSNNRRVQTQPCHGMPQLRCCQTPAALAPCPVEPRSERCDVLSTSIRPHAHSNLMT
jgi:hypothetical protein